ncbi:anthranilate synthase component I family protein [Aneurinibacillus sp. Ricciae_BoGa-3]|uniref:anthranilate synthase component I family protein n=1 Tax=Aneurinibacillus sp. Ricciae_BoGa-3 TaxID=3022697 RepID=UPI00234230B7|nr:anthranilate synthase component I family protein [Aneurinibacillus sp. Ricciae_BoGa-3]WCK54647.1 anthranilate synthase component I family protein [Aneurinibacillus sp. Ricciae_BoGa-3]
MVNNREQVKKWLLMYKRVPVWEKVSSSSVDPWSLYVRITRGQPYGFIMESGRSGRYTYVGTNPGQTIQIKNNQVKVSGMPAYTSKQDPMAIIREWMDHPSSPHSSELAGFSLPDWAGGAIGYLSYDMVKYYEAIPIKAKDDLELPDVYLMMADELYAFDQLTGDIYLIVYVGENARLSGFEEGAQRIAYMEQMLKEAISDFDSQLAEQAVDSTAERLIEKSFDQPEFEEAVRKIQEYIASGDVFQVNLSVRQAKTMDVSAEQVYSILRRINPSPYMGLLRFPEFQLVSASPELLIQVKSNSLSTRPIAGTRPRGKDGEEDNLLVAELLENEKEAAEHIMLVDLERNDIGRVSKYGSVEVNELMVVEKYSHVMHIVSNVIGELADGKDMYDAIISTFPGGTITGAPKVRTMEIIEELEPVKRGPYTGSMCLFGFSGDAICNIIIRTLIAKDGKAYVQAGAGIVIDSSPKAEYYESLKKAEALWRALSLSQVERSKV